MMKGKNPDDSRRKPGQGPARADQAREARQAEALRANLRKRKAQAKAQAQGADSGASIDGKSK